jgi:ribosomal protein L35
MRPTRTGKLKHNNGFHTHLMSARPASKRRKIRRASVLFEGHARNMRQMMGISGIHPNKIRHERELAAKAAAAEGKPAKSTAERK